MNEIVKVYLTKATFITLKCLNLKDDILVNLAA